MKYNRFNNNISSILFYIFIYFICLLVKMAYSTEIDLSSLSHFIQFSYYYCKLNTMSRDFLLFIASILPILYLIIKFSFAFNFRIRNQSYLLLFYKSKAKYIFKEITNIMIKVLFIVLITFIIQIIFHVFYTQAFSINELFKSMFIFLFYVIHLLFYIILACLLNVLYSNQTISVILVTSMLLIIAMLSNILNILTYFPIVFFWAGKNISMISFILYGLLDVIMFVYFYHKTKYIELY